MEDELRFSLCPSRPFVEMVELAFVLGSGCGVRVNCHTVPHMDVNLDIALCSCFSDSLRPIAPSVERPDVAIFPLSLIRLTTSSFNLWTLFTSHWVKLKGSKNLPDVMSHQQCSTIGISVGMSSGGTSGTIDSNASENVVIFEDHGVLSEVSSGTGGQ